MQDIKQQRVTSAKESIPATSHATKTKKIKQINKNSTYIPDRGHEKIEKSYDKKNTKLTKIVNTMPK